MPSTDASQIVCHECDLLIGVPFLMVGQKAYCPRCNYLLVANRPSAESIVFAFAVSGLLFLILANMFPFIGFSARGQGHSVTLLQSVAVLMTSNFPSLAVIVFASIVAIPAMFLVGVVYVSSSLALQHPLPSTKTILRWVLQLAPWSMAEIFLVGILVSFIKIVAMADVSLGYSFWSYALFSACITVVVLHLDKRHLWQRVKEFDS